MPGGKPPAPRPPAAAAEEQQPSSLGHTQLMTSKWCDAFMQLKAFCAAARMREKDERKKCAVQLYWILEGDVRPEQPDSAFA